MDYEREISLNNILKHFDNDLENITKQELASYAFNEMLKMSSNPKNLKPSSFKIFSITQVSTIFIYQELFEAHSQAFFNTCINTTKHKESTASLIHVACDFGNLYASLNDDKKIAHLNNVFVDEIKKVKNDAQDEKKFNYLHKLLFDDDGNFSTQLHLLKIVEIQNHFIEKKFFSKNDIFSLLMLFGNYTDSKLLQLYHHIKIMCNIHTTQNHITKDEIKNIANDYISVKNKKHIETFNHFFNTLCEHIKNYYFCQIDDKYINISFEKISQEIRVPKWYDILWMKKDDRLLAKNTIKIQQELRDIQPDYSELPLSSKIFENNFKIFSSISMLIHEHDIHFETITQLSKLLNHDFAEHYSVAGMNIKNYYERTNNQLEIEAINRVLIFWSLINEKSYLKKTGITS